ncbi:PIN domain-containing protein [Pyxidicoccus fallax]|uniref:PIN domain-containing protein n=1 Tax=Pyxidicoccus fallax TaxID=394095 RepID=A0A848L9T1_9BACT|nr:PIN domain-containing protein [Pyxidicoccus fallax]NPC78436.1 PIN domain-containing protein [Pyxidicoccus fallax]
MHYAPFPVVLDANVLIPLTLCDALLGAAEEGLIQIYWSEEILEEVRRNLVEKIGLTEAKAVRRVSTMREFFPQAMVTGYEQQMRAMTNHPKDRHVLAVATHVGAQTIVTNNLRDFGAEHLPRSMQAQDADTFLRNLLSQAPIVMIELLRSQAEIRKNPPVTFKRLLEGLEKSVPKFVEEVREFLPPSPLVDH